MHIAEWKKPIWKYESKYITFWKRQNYGDNKRLVVARGRGGDRWISIPQRISRAVEISVYYYDEYMSLYICTNP